MRAVPSRGMFVFGVIVNGMMASLITTCATWISSGPCIAHVELDLVPFERVPFNGKFLHWRCGLQIQPATGGEEEHDHSNEENDWDEEQDEGLEGEARGLGRLLSYDVPLLRHFEHAVPAEFSKLGYMRVEHVHTRISVGEFKNAALRLPLNDRVREFRGDEARAGGVVMEKICVQMEGVDQIEFKDVDQIDADRLADFDLDGMVLIMKWNGIDRVKIIRIIEVHIKAAHHHDQFMVNRRATFFWVDNEGPVESFGDMTRQRERRGNDRDASRTDPHRIHSQTTRPAGPFHLDLSQGCHPLSLGENHGSASNADDCCRC